MLLRCGLLGREERRRVVVWGSEEEHELKARSWRWMWANLRMQTNYYTKYFFFHSPRQEKVLSGIKI